MSTSIPLNVPAPAGVQAPTALTGAPQHIQNAAASLNAALQAGLGQTRDHGFPGLTIGDLRANQFTTVQADRALADATRGVPALNTHPGLDFRTQQNQVTNIDQLFRATTVNKQLRAFEFAATGQFSYRSQLKIDNVNAVTFAYGALKHLEAIKSGLLGHESDTEFLSRIRHLRNVFEICFLSSNLQVFLTRHGTLLENMTTESLLILNLGLNPGSLCLIQLNRIVSTVLRKRLKTVIGKTSLKSKFPPIILRKMVKSLVKRLVLRLTFIGVVMAAILNSKMKGKLAFTPIIALGAKLTEMSKKSIRA